MWSRVSRVRLEPVYLEWNETVSVRVGPVKESRSPSAAPSRRLNCRIVERLANLRSVEATCPPDTGTLYCPLPCRNRGAAPGAHHPNKPKFSHITLAGRSSSSETVVKKNFWLLVTPIGDQPGPPCPSYPSLFSKSHKKELRTSSDSWGPQLGTNPALRARPIQAYSQRVVKKNFGLRRDSVWGPTPTLHARVNQASSEAVIKESVRLCSNPRGFSQTPTLGTQYSLFYYYQLTHPILEVTCCPCGKEGQ